MINRYLIVPFLAFWFLGASCAPSKEMQSRYTYLKYLNKDPFTTYTETYRDLEGNLTKTRMLIKQLGKNSITYFFVTKLSKNNSSQFVYEVEYYGSDWMFYEGVKLKYDDKLELKNDSKPVREVINTGVYELLTFQLSNNEINLLVNSDAMQVQIGNEIFSIDKNGIKEISDFIK